MWALLKLIGKRLLAAFAVVVILLAIAMGGFRLLMGQLPGYQNELKAWVSDELGLELAFVRVDAAWGLNGPQLTFHEARLAGAGQEEALLDARQAQVGVDIVALLLDRQVRVDRLTLSGARLTVRRAQDGTLSLQGVPIGGNSQLSVDDLPPVRLLVRDSRVRYVDARSGAAWDIDDVDIDLGRAPDLLTLQARARAPEGLGSRLELVAESEGAAPSAQHTWRMALSVRAADLAAWRPLLGDRSWVPTAGRGDLSFLLELSGGRLMRAEAEVAVSDVMLNAPRLAQAADHVVYERVELAGVWERLEDGWRLGLDRMALNRPGRAWPEEGGLEVVLQEGMTGPLRLRLRGDYLRLEDLTPLVALLPDRPALEAWFALAPEGELRDAELALTRAGDLLDYQLAGTFEGLSFEPYGRWPGLKGLSGEVRADARSGRLVLASENVAMTWPGLFESPLPADELAGVVVWRQGRNGYRIVSDDLLLANRDVSTRSNLELTVPLDGSSPRLELETQAGGFHATVVKKYFPARGLPPTVAQWLDSSIRGGWVPRARLTWFGPLSAFPYDRGEGQFRVTADIEGGVLAFVEDWPVARELTGTIEFINAGFRAQGRGGILGNEARDVRVAIADMRAPVLTLAGTTTGPLSEVLAFLNDAPLIARHLGPDLARLQAPRGTGEVTLDLRLPLRDRPAYQLDASLRMTDAELAVDGFEPRATEVRGALDLHNHVVTAEWIDAVFLNGPVRARVVPADRPGYRSRIDIEGEVTADAVARAFRLPVEAYVAGQTRWQGSVHVPAVRSAADAPLRVEVSSNLNGVALRFPAPFSKPPGEPTNLRLDLALGDGLQVQGNLGATRRFALDFALNAQGIDFLRGEVAFGGALPSLPEDDGLRVRGDLPLLHLEEWLSMPHAVESASLMDSVLVSADLSAAEFSALGQPLGAAHLKVSRTGDVWQVDIDSEGIAGVLTIPRDLRQRPQITAEMHRLRLMPAGGDEHDSGMDPRRLPGLKLSAQEFAIGNRRFGVLQADVQADPLGLRLVSFDATASSFTVHGSGGWFNGSSGPTTRLAFSLASGDLAAALSELDFDPVAEGELAQVTASLHWRGGPGAEWMRSLNGDIALRIEEGSMLDLEPGAGRVMGLMSITALPRRLALDFRDVFNRGLVFDEITGDFLIVDGNAYTDNLKLTGPVAEIGIVGRTGLQEHDYEQQAVVTAEPGKMLPTVGGLLAGPGVGAALLIFTQIFKEPLKGIGRASYCVTGTWEQPSVERLTPEELQRGRLCAGLPPEGLTMVRP